MSEGVIGFAFHGPNGVIPHTILRGEIREFVETISIKAVTHIIECMASPEPHDSNRCSTSGFSPGYSPPSLAAQSVRLSATPNADDAVVIRCGYFVTGAHNQEVIFRPFSV